MNSFAKLMMGCVIAGSLAFAQTARSQNAKPSNDQLAEQVKAVLKQNSDLRADDLRVQVENGVAYVSGQVSTTLESREIRESISKDVVAKVPGVTKVVVQTNSASQ